MTDYNAAAIQAAGAIASNIVSGRHASRENRKNREFQERMYYQQLEDNRKNWEMVNAYNLPSAAMQRLRDAGLNPMLYYSEGTGNVVAQSSPQGGSQPSGNAALPGNFMNPFEGFTNSVVAMKKLQSEIKNLDADSESKLADVLLRAEQTLNERESRGGIKADVEFKVQSLRDKVEKAHIDNRVAESQATLNEELARTEPKKREEIKANIANLEKQLDVYQVTIDDVQNQIKNRDIITEAQRKQIYNSIENANKVTAATVYKLNQEGRKAFAEAYILEIEGAIHDMPEWQAMQLYKEAAELKALLETGTEKEIENALNKITLRYSGRSGSSQEFQEFLNSWVNPIMDSAGKILGPAVGGYAGAKLGRRGK